MEVPIHKPIDHVLLREQLQKLLLILDGATRTKDELRRPHVLVWIVDCVVVVFILFEIVFEVLDLVNSMIRNETTWPGMKRLTSSSIAMK